MSVRVAELERALTAIPLSWVSWSYALREGESTLCVIETSWWTERGTVAIGRENWRLERESWMQGEFTLKQGGRTFAKAQKPNAMFRSFQVTFDDARFVWEAESVMTRAFVLRQGNRVVGSVRPTNMLTRQAIVELPAELSLERKAFLVWLAVLMWRRAQTSS